MRAFIAALRGQGDLAMLLLRLVLASIFIVAGYNKFFGAGLERVTQMFTGYGVVPVPAVAAPFIAALEFAGGILLALGLFTRYVAVLYFLEFLLA
ncbi:MAG TPA: DoxX family membrane protein, partial [bacterium]